LGLLTFDEADWSEPLTDDEWTVIAATVRCDSRVLHLTAAEGLLARAAERIDTRDTTQLAQVIQVVTHHAISTDGLAGKRVLSSLATKLSAGATDTAVAAVRAMLDRIDASLDADHPRTLTTRHNLANWLGQSGHTDEAVKQLTTLAEDSSRVLGADHPHTLTTRNLLKHWQRQTKRVRGHL
jgi:hypothetical protein